MTMTRHEALSMTTKTVVAAMMHPQSDPEIRELIERANIENIGTSDVQTMKIAYDEAQRALEAGDYESASYNVLAFGMFIVSQAPLLLEFGKMSTDAFEHLIEGEDEA